MSIRYVHISCTRMTQWAKTSYTTSLTSANSQNSWTTYRACSTGFFRGFSFLSPFRVPGKTSVIRVLVLLLILFLLLLILILILLLSFYYCYYYYYCCYYYSSPPSRPSFQQRYNLHIAITNRIAIRNPITIQYHATESVRNVMFFFVSQFFSSIFFLYCFLQCFFFLFVPSYLC